MKEKKYECLRLGGKRWRNCESMIIPGPTKSIHGRGGLYYGKTEYNKLPPGPPTNNPCIPSHHDGPLLPNQTEPSGTPPEPSTSHAPADVVAKTIVPASSNIAGDLEGLPSDECTASSSPDSPATTKPSSH